MRRRTTGLVLLFVLLAVLGAGWGAWRYYFFRPGPLTESASIVVNPGEGASTIADKLTANFVIQHPIPFKLAIRLKQLGGSLKAGEYSFEPHMSLRRVVDKLADGDTESRSLTIPEGWTVAQAVRRLNEQAALSGETYGVPEGMLFPDTYQFRLGQTRPTLLKAMQERMRRELDAAWAARSPDLPYQTPDDLLTLASIVQKEAATDAEMPQIAAVFVNRLKQGMKLQADPTVLYGAETTSDTAVGRIRRKDLTEPQPFNTYIYKGLPPTPIANPGRAALQAAARPAATGDLYFMADPARTHHVFSTTYADHQKNVARYWKLVGTVGASPTLPPAVSATLVSPATLASGTVNPAR